MTPPTRSLSRFGTSLFVHATAFGIAIVWCGWSNVATETLLPTVGVLREEPAMQVPDEAPEDVPCDVPDSVLDEPVAEVATHEDRLEERGELEPEPRDESLPAIDPPPRARAARISDWMLVVRPRRVEPEAPPVLPASASKAASLVLTPLPGACAPPRYPVRALRLGIEGRVVLRVEIDARGRVVDCRVVQSSGSRLLDDRALRAVSGWRFAKGPAVARVRIEFRLADLVGAAKARTRRE